MSKYMLMLLFCWSCKLQAQHLFQAPFLSYLGRGIEDHKISLLGRLPYEGIGKKMLLEQYPQLWTSTFSRYNTNNHPLVDAFGAIGPNYSGVQKTKVGLLLDQFGTVEGDFANRYKLKYLELVNVLNQQSRPKSDINRNQLLDFTSGQRFTVHNSLSYQRGKINTGAASYFTRGTSYGGSTQVKTQQESGLPVEGYTQNAQHWQLGLWFNLNDTDWGNLGLAVDLNQHRQDLHWKTYGYQGREQQTSYLLTYRREQGNSDLYFAWQYVQDKATEKLDTVQIVPKDEYWRGIVEWGHVLNDRLFLESRLNIEKHLDQGLTFRPALQLDWSIRGGGGYVFSFFANSGQRLNKPLTLHLDRLSSDYTVNWQVQDYEIAHKVGVHFTGTIWRDHFFKLILDHTWFKHKIITNWDNIAKLLVFSNAKNVLQRSALELVSGAKLIPQKNLEAHLMYRWEQWSANPKLPWQANHAIQLRLKWEHKRSTFATHYLLRSPQQILNVPAIPATTDVSPLYHRLDLSYLQKFKHFHRTKHWSNFFSLQFQLINALGAGPSGRQFETALFWPEANAPYWSDPQLRNIQVSVRQEF